MKAARIYGSNDIRVVEVETPVPQDHEVLCQVIRAGMCGTDYAIYSGEFSFIKQGLVPMPMTPGHEWSGRVVEIGGKVTLYSRGDRVVGDTAVSCGHCYQCLIGQYGKCEKMRCVGTINPWDGAYAEYILMPERHLMKLHDSISFENGAWVEPAATALYSVQAVEVKIGDTVLVLGSGPIGIAAAKLAKVAGASIAAIVGRKEFKLEKSLAMGIDAAINTTTTDLRDGIKGVFGRFGVDKIIEASGSVDLLKRSARTLNIGGTVSPVAFYEKTVPEFPIDDFVFGNLTLRGSAGSLGMYQPVLRLMEKGMLDMTSLITRTYSLDEAPRAMMEMKEKNATRIKPMIVFD
jgi:2-desacetyl-2-hydroxyethyl bacteriochlorophyllide A dehydrogenase